MAQLPEKLRAALASAERQLVAGDPQSAIRLAEPVAQAAPKLVGAQLLLARAHRDIGNTDLALSRFRAAAEASGGNEALWQEFVLELLKAGQKGRARSTAQKAPLKPPARKKLMELAKSGIQRGGAALGGVDPAQAQAVQDLLRQDRIEEARAKAEALLASHPKSAFVHNLRGLAALAAEDHETAIDCFRETLRLSPEFSGAAANLGFTLTLLHRFDDATAVLRNAAVHDPRSSDVLTNLADACVQSGRYAEAAEHAGRLLDLAPDDPTGLQLRAFALVMLKRAPEALPLVERLARIADGPKVQRTRFDALAGSGREEEALDYARSLPSMPDELALNYAELLAQMGRLDEARQAMVDLIERNPDVPFAYYHYGTMARWTEEDPVLKTLRAQTKPEDTKRNLPKLAMAFYARAKAETDLKNDADVFPALHRANALHGEGVPFNPKDFITQGDQIVSTWTRARIETLSEVGTKGVRPIFIVGMPRSGSTLTDRILAAHPEVASIGEDSLLAPEFPLDLAPKRDAVRMAGNAGISQIHATFGRTRRYLDKYLANCFRLGMLAAAYPEAVFLETRRDPRSIALSIYSNAMRVPSHPYSTSLEGIAQFYLYVERVMAHWRETLGDRVVAVDYATLVSDPEPRIRRLLEECRLPWNDACLSPEAVQDRVKTLSLAQVRSGINTGSVEKWRRFEKELEPFTRILQEAGAL